MLRLLPIGTVVRLKGASVPFMIAGYFPEDPAKPGYYFDYSGFPHPIGFSSNIQASFFGSADIEKILAMGYQDEEELEYVKKLESFQPEAQEKEDGK
ncbi:MAG TPA: DUF4176 domain-containing protein [Candidatus Eisenbergiella intestinipullorum]|nr:DUF4176 domain-containing protein [Candidatus Eisenbergiella intestinipullorum]